MPTRICSEPEAPQPRGDSESQPMRIQPLAIFTAFVLLILAAAPVAAQSLDEMRATGAIGERFDGLAVAREAAAGVQAMVAQVNAKRLEIYSQRAAQEGVGVGDVGRVYAQQIMQKAPAGTWFLTEGGQWRQR